MGKRKFWNLVRDSDTGERTLVLNGTIAEESWFGDEVTPAIFRDELTKGEGDITVWINSLGGDVYAAAQIYNMLMDYKGKVTVRIDGIAASAASMVAMAGEPVEMSPVGMFMIHNPATVAIGDKKEMQAAIEMLGEVKESIINAYELKTGLSHDVLSDYMDAETWFNAKKALELGFVDKILFANDEEERAMDAIEGMVFSQRTVTNSLIDKIKAQSKLYVQPVKPTAPDNRVSADALMSRLNLIVH